MNAVQKEQSTITKTEVEELLAARNEEVIASAKAKQLLSKIELLENKIQKKLSDGVKPPRGFELSIEFVPISARVSWKNVALGLAGELGKDTAALEADEIQAVRAKGRTKAELIVRRTGIKAVK